MDGQAGACPRAGPIAILAGSGELPILLANRMAALGTPYRVLAFQGFCERTLRTRADAVVGLLDIRRVHALLDAWQPAAITLAGGLTRPSAAALVGAFSAYRDRDEIMALAARGDDNLLRGAIDFLQSKGFTLLGVRDLAPDLLAPEGPHGRCQPEPDHDVAIATGFALLDSIASYDIGQAAVVVGQRVLAIEGPEGTDRMLHRARSLNRRWVFSPRARGGVLVKGPKRGQDLRVDLPAIGPRTVANAARAGLDGIAIASGLTLVINRAETIAAADRLGLFLTGVEREVANEPGVVSD